jgi:alkaline phosphatase D
MTHAMRALGSIGWAVLLAGCTSETLNPLPADFNLPDGGAVSLPTRIGFGSCSDPAFPMTALDVASDLEPELYIWLGDNVYADTNDEQVMRGKYGQLASSEEFIRLHDQAQLLATWDDHDFGANDAGKDYPMKEASQEIFLEFWQEPAESDRWERNGIYTSYSYQDAGKVLQIILLDTRYNRDPLTPNDGAGKNDYVPNAVAERTILGDAQWAWLEQQLLQEADLRIVASSIQFAHEYNGYESWTLFPNERKRFVDLLETTQAEGVVLLSGDVHWGEISRLAVDGGYDLYDVTSSGINRNWPFVETNANRIGDAVPEFNVGLLVIDWDAATVTTTLYDTGASPRAELALDFEQLAF